MGDWKLVERTGAPPIEHRNKRKAEVAERKRKAAAKHDELFNLKDDVAEAHEAAADHADLAAKMKKQLVKARDQGFTRPQ
jgi:arylsulfatase A-like enzyme